MNEWKVEEHSGGEENKRKSTHTLPASLTEHPVCQVPPWEGTYLIYSDVDIDTGAGQPDRMLGTDV